jgi:hypothetical protein
MSVYEDMQYDLIKMILDRDERVAIRDEMNREIVDLDIEIRRLKWKVARMMR